MWIHSSLCSWCSEDRAWLDYLEHNLASRDVSSCGRRDYTFLHESRRGTDRPLTTALLNWPNFLTAFISGGRLFHRRVPCKENRFLPQSFPNPTRADWRFPWVLPRVTRSHRGRDTGESSLTLCTLTLGIREGRERRKSRTSPETGVSWVIIIDFYFWNEPLFRRCEPGSDVNQECKSRQIRSANHDRSAKHDKSGVS